MSKKLKASLIVLGVLMLGLVGTTVSAKTDFWEVVATKLATLLEKKVAAPSMTEVADSEVRFGSAQTSPTNLTDSGTLNNQGSLYLYDNQTGGGLEVAGAAFMKGSLSVSGTIYNSGTSSLGNISSVVASGSFNDATTTLKCIANPFVTTSTAGFVSFMETGISTTSFYLSVATSTITIGLSTSTPAFSTSSPQAQLLNISLVPNTAATGTRYMSTGVVDSRTTQNVLTATSIPVAPGESVCFVAGEGNGGSTAGITNSNNLFAGTYGVEFKR